MPKNVYSEINLHMTWHTKNDDPVLTAEIENRVHHYLEHKIRDAKNVIFHAVGGIEDHVHTSIMKSPIASCWIGRTVMEW
jgi:putative transposase